LKKIQNKNREKNEKPQKLMPLWKKGPKCHKRVGKPNVTTWPFIFSDAFRML
jgi:hypothetical protein